MGPKPTSRFSHHGVPVCSGCALTTTALLCNSCERAFVSAKVGISVLKWVVAFEPLYVSFWVNVPWIAVPLDVISLT